MLSIFEILICVVAAGFALVITRKKPWLGIVLAIGFVALILAVAAVFTSRAPSASNIRIVERTTFHEDWNHTHDEARVRTRRETITTGPDFIVSFSSTDCPEGDCEDQDDADQLADCSDCDEPCDDCKQIAAEVDDEKDFEQDDAEIVLADSEELLKENEQLLEDSAAWELAQLSVEKPEWVYNMTSNVGDAKRLVVRSGPCESMEECKSELVWAMKEAVGEYAEQYLRRAGRRLPDWFNLEIPSDELYDAITNRWDGLHDFDIAGADPMPVTYVELSLDSRFHERVLDRGYDQALQMSRIAQSGVGSLGILGLIATVFTFLKIDNWTGFRRRGLLAIAFGTSFAILMGFGLILLAAF